MRIFISILGICSHMTLKDKVECQDKLTRALSKAAARLRQVFSGRPSMQVLPYQCFDGFAKMSGLWLLIRDLTSGARLMCQVRGFGIVRR